MVIIKWKIYYLRLLEAYISTNSSEDLQLKAKKGIARRFSFEIKYHKGQPMLCRLFFSLKMINRWASLQALKNILQKCIYLPALEPLLHDAPSNILKYVVAQYSKVSKVLPPQIRTQKPALIEIFRAQIIFRSCRTIHQHAGSLSHLAVWKRFKN